MGSRIVCRKSTNGIPSTAVTTWEDYDGHYYLLNATDTIPFSSQQPANGLIYQAGLSSAVWETGINAICKVKTWTEGMEISTIGTAVSRCNWEIFPENINSTYAHHWGEVSFLSC